VSATRVGRKTDKRRRKAVLDEVLRLGRAIGWRRWGMVMLYYRAGLTQGEIGLIFGLRRQSVAYELRRAFEIAAEIRGLRRMCSGGRALGRRQTARPDFDISR
jgi:hypothetical protein